MAQQAIKQKELIILISFLLGFVILLSIAGLYFRDHKTQPEKVKEEPTFVEGTISKSNQNENAQPEQESQKIGSNTFFLKPSAADVLSALREADPYSEPQMLENTQAMKVMWPGYFFSTQDDSEKTAIVQLDVDESGFGVILICRVTLDDYPEVKNLTPGQKIWVAGEITEIDLEGTGSVFITVEYIRFDEEGPAAAAPSPQNNRQ